MAFHALAGLAEWDNFTTVLENGNWERLVKFLPQQLVDTNLYETDQIKLNFFRMIAPAISEHFDYFNIIFERHLAYLFNPSPINADFGVFCICHGLSMYFAALLPNNPIQINYFAVLERLVQLKNEEKDDDILLKIYSVIGMILGLERLDDMKYFQVRKEIMEDFLAVLESKKTKDCEYLSDLMLCAFAFPGESSEELVEIFLGNEKFVKILHKCMSKCSVNASGGGTLASLLLCCKMCPKAGVKCFMKYNFMKTTFLVITKELDGDPEDFNELDIIDILEGLEELLKEAEHLVDGNKFLYNPIALQIEEKKGLVLLKKLTRDVERDCSVVAKRIISGYFGKNWENYLARRRGLKTKKAC